jgi:hypothetical protein
LAQALNYRKLETTCIDLLLAAGFLLACHTVLVLLSLMYSGYGDENRDYFHN